MLSESLRRRLETLNRERLPSAAPGSKSQPQERSPDRSPASVQPQRRPAGNLLESAVESENTGGRHLVITVPVEDLWRGGEQRVAGRLEHLQSLPEAELAPGMAPLVAAMPRRAVMLDLETCGLSGAALFLVGLLRTIDGRPTVELLFARNYAEERAVMVSLWDRLRGEDGLPCDVVATFNGKSFDWPMVMDRSRRHLLHKQRHKQPGAPKPAEPLHEPQHIDVLHAARRRWKKQLPDCKLQTIERLVCRRPRSGDIPGSQIPAAYDAFVRTGRPQEMEAVLHHNALDLVTLLDVALRVAA